MDVNKGIGMGEIIHGNGSDNPSLNNGRESIILLK